MSGTLLYGIDCASGNGIPDGKALAAAGYSFGVVKISGGKSYRNPLAAAQLAALADGGLARLVYHYDGEPSIATGTPDEEATNFLGAVAAVDGRGLGYALDAEERATRDPVRYKTWFDRCEAALLRRGLLYTYHDFVTERPDLPWQLVADHGLWFASWPGVRPTGATAPPPPPAPWKTVALWQWDGGSSTPPGMASPTDQDVFYGDLGALVSLGALGAVAAMTDEAERAALLADSSAIPVFARGDLVREGIVDLTAFGGGMQERIALYAKQYFHRLNGTTQTFFRDPQFAGSYAALHAAGKVTLYGDGPDITQ